MTLEDTADPDSHATEQVTAEPNGHFAAFTSAGVTLRPGDHGSAALTTPEGHRFAALFAVFEADVTLESSHLHGRATSGTLVRATVQRTDTIYDLASLTKVVVTTTLSMILVDEGKLDLDARVHAFFPAFSGPAKERVSVRHLLTHSGGLLWWAPLYQEVKGKAAYLARIVAMDLAYEPGAKSVYSDLGIVLLGEILERVSGTTFAELAQRRVFDPLEMKDCLYRPPAALLDRIAPTENDPWRGRVVRGEVHDENAAALGGVAPHAGLFGTAPGLAHLAQMLLAGGTFHGRRLVSRATVELFTERRRRVL